MSTKKISALTELTTTPATGDEMPIVDASDTTDAASGTTKRIKAATLFQAAGIGAGTTSAEPLKVDTSNGRLGIGTASPNARLDIYSTDQNEGIDLIGNVGGQDQNSSSTRLRFHGNGQTNGPFIQGVNVDAYGLKRLAFFATRGASDYTTLPTESMSINAQGNVLIGGTAIPTNSQGNLCLFNGTAPSASIANGVVLYAQDTTSSSELKVRDEAGNISTLSPHNFDLLGERSEPMAWSYSSKNAFVGKEIAVDMTKVIRALEKLTGESYVKIRDIADSEKLDWATEEKRKEDENKAEIVKSKASEGVAEPAAYTKKSKPSWIG